MLKKEYNYFDRISLKCGLLLFITGILFFPGTSFTEVSVSSYCELSTQSIQEQVSNFQELIALANQYSNDPDSFATVEAAKQAEFEEKANTLMVSFGMTTQEYVLYMGKYKKEVEAYWNDNPTLKEQLDELAAEAFALMTEGTKALSPRQ